MLIPCIENVFGLTAAPQTTFSSAAFSDALCALLAFVGGIMWYAVESALFW